MNLTLADNRREQRAIEARIATALPDKSSAEEYETLRSNWSKGNKPTDPEGTVRRHAHTRSMFKQFLAQHPEVINLHNRLAELGVMAQKTSPFPTFSTEDMALNTIDTAGDVVAGEPPVKKRRVAVTTVGRTPAQARSVQPLTAKKSTVSKTRARLVPSKFAHQISTARPKRQLQSSRKVKESAPVLSEIETRITNPQAFPCHLIVNWGATSIAPNSMYEHRVDGKVQAITADLQNCYYRTLVITSSQPQVLNALGATGNISGWLVPDSDTKIKLMMVPTTFEATPDCPAARVVIL